MSQQNPSIFKNSKRMFVLMSVCCIVGCSNKNPNENAQQIKPLEQAETTSSATFTDTPTAVEGTEPEHSVQPEQIVKCHSGETVNGQCVCGNVTITVKESEDWACADGFWRCLNSAGCYHDGIEYPISTDFTENGIQCGYGGDIPNREQYKCNGISDWEDNGSWVCLQQACNCYNNTIKYKAFCKSKSCQGVAVDKTDGLMCTEDGWTVQESKDYKIGDRYFHLDENVVLKKESLKCGVYELPFSEAGQYSCRNPGWNRSYHWTCNSEYGCECGKAQCKKGQQCDNGECKNTVSVCTKGNCPCGDGFCMKGGVCVEGHCICGEREEYMMNDEIESNGEAEININDKYWQSEGGNIGRTNYIFVSNRFGEFTCESSFTEGTCYDKNNYARCLREDGCYTSDGRHYAYNAIAPGNDEEPEEYHVDLGYNVIISTPESGACIIHRTDELKLKKDAGKGAKTYICDENRCECGKDKCKYGQICRDGKCERDTCKLTSEQLKRTFIKNDPDCTESNETEDEDSFSDDEECSGRWSISYDIHKCEGGTLYCRDVKDTKAHIAPKNPQGYQCSWESWMERGHKAWVCNSSDCICGDSPCPRDAACIDEVCTYKGKPVPEECKNKGCWYSYKGICVCSESKTEDENSSNDNLKESSDETNLKESPSETNLKESSDETNLKESGTNKEGGDKQEKQPTKCNDEVMPGNGYVCDLSHSNPRGWRCNSKEGCDCKGRFAPFDSFCKEGKILCDNINIEDGDTHQYACELINDYSEAKVWRCKEEDGCTCGNTKCSGLEVCLNGTCICNRIIKPGDGFECNRGYDLYSWRCTEENGCNCSFKNEEVQEYEECTDRPGGYFSSFQIKDGAYYCGNQRLNNSNLSNYYCENNKDIICASSICTVGGGKNAVHCIQGNIVENGKCLDPKTRQPIKIDSNGYYNEGIVSLCLSDKKCTCNKDKQKCNVGQLCTFNGCEDLELVYSNDHLYAGYLELDEELDDERTRDEINFPNWQEEYASYFFSISTNEIGDCSDRIADHELTYICALEEGCKCGDVICSQGGQCLDGKCKESSSSIKNGYAFCESTKIKIPVNGFECMTMGWLCTGEKCVCGDAECKKDEVCLKMGECAPIK